MLLKILTLLCVIACAVAEPSPVLLWGVSTESKPTLATLQQNEFAALLQPYLEKYTVVAFMEDDLSVSDLSCHNVDSAQSCYAHLRSVSPKTYYAQVESPLEALRTLTQQRAHVSIDAEGQFSAPVEAKPGNVYFVNFDSVKLSRGATLEAHDTAMQAASKQLSGNIIYLYLSGTTKASPSSSIASRVRRETAALQGGYIFREGAQFLIFYTNLYYKPNGANAVSSLVSLQSMTVTNVSDTEFNVTMPTATAGVALTFTIMQEGGYYYMQNVVYDGVAFRSDDMNAPFAFSYHCGNQTLKAVNTLESSNNARLYWNSLQFQAPFGTITDPNFVFGDGWDCVYFFTPGILSAFFVSIVLLFILFTGICWMMDVNTMDRFEDPKGKPLTINAGE